MQPNREVCCLYGTRYEWFTLSSLDLNENCYTRNCSYSSLKLVWNSPIVLAKTFNVFLIMFSLQTLMVYLTRINFLVRVNSSDDEKSVSYNIDIKKNIFNTHSSYSIPIHIKLFTFEEHF